MRKGYIYIKFRSKMYSYMIFRPKESHLICAILHNLEKRRRAKGEAPRRGPMTTMDRVT